MIPPRALVADQVDNSFNTIYTREETNRKGLTGNDVLRDFSSVKRVGTILGKSNNVYYERVSRE